MYPRSFRAASVSRTCGKSAGTRSFLFSSKMARYVLVQSSSCSGVSPGNICRNPSPSGIPMVAAMVSSSFSGRPSLRRVILMVRRMFARVSPSVPSKSKMIMRVIAIIAKIAIKELSLP